MCVLGHFTNKINIVSVPYIFEITRSLMSMEKGKGKDLTRPHDKNPYIHRTFNKAK